MSTATHTQGSMALLFSTADHLALSRILQWQASARGLDFKWHDSNSSDPEAILASLRKQGRHASLVIFGGGGWQAGSALHTPASAWQQAWESQCLSGARVGQAAIRHMLPRQQGTLIYLGHEGGHTDSQAVRRTPAASFSASHAAASAGLRSLAQSMARAFGPQRVHVAHVILGGTAPFDDARAFDAANTCWSLHAQNPSAWTHELDLRPSPKHD